MIQAAIRLWRLPGERGLWWNVYQHLRATQRAAAVAQWRGTSFRRVTEDWSYGGTWLICEQHGVQRQVEAIGINTILDEVPVVVGVFHPASPWIFPFGEALHDLFPGRRVIPTAKVEHAKNPLGQGILGVGGALIPREGDEQGIRALRECFERAISEHEGVKAPVIVLFMDGHRPKPGRIRAANAHLARMGYGGRVQYVQVPFPSGLSTLMNVAPNAAFVEGLLHLDLAPPSGLGYSVKDIRGRTLHLRFEHMHYPGFEMDREALKHWLCRQALRADGIVADWIAE